MYDRRFCCCVSLGLVLCGCCPLKHAESTEPATRISSGKSVNSAADLTFTDKDETVIGTVSAPSDVFGPAIERAMARLKIPFKEKPHTTQLDGMAVVNPIIGPEVYIEYSTTSDHFRSEEILKIRPKGMSTM